MRKTVFLLIAAIALAAYVYFYEIKGGEKREKAKEISEKLFNVEKDSINHIEIKSTAGNFIFNKNSDGWQIEQPVKTGADESPINSLLSSIDNTKKSRTFSIKAGEKGQYGLGRSATLLKVTQTSGEMDSVLLGDKTSIGSNVYATMEDTAVYLVPQSIKTNASKSLFDWRNKKTILFKKDEVREFTLSSPHGKFTFEKDGSDWKITKPIETKAERSAIDGVLNKLSFTNFKSVLSEEPSGLSKYGLSRPAYDIELFSGPEKAKTSVAFSKLDGNESNGKDAARPFIFTVDSTFIKPFNKDLFGFRDKSIIDFETGKATRINLSNNNEVMTFMKDTSDTWYLSTGEKAKNYKINSLLSSIKNLKAEKFINENPTYFMNYGLVNPESRIEVYEGDNLIAELNLGYKKDGFVYVYNPDRKPVVTIKEEKLKDLFPPKTDLLEEVKDNKESTEK